ncbi:MAG: UDP-3-O-(3-hydroxymyristoyl)glucosamine N-acyltransferase [Kiritimatiellaeota bacterium]|nr:UDP-3-O-(3-hydroxymyristoyl)glucosamine N-acyltransferase [Kiritimatiellota bacterium]
MSDSKIKTTTEIAELIGGTVRGDAEALVSGVQSLKDAKKEDVSFLGNKKYTEQVPDTAAAAVIVGPDYDVNNSGGATLIVCETPNIAFAKVIEFFAPPPPEYPPMIHPSAVVADSARVGNGVHVGPCAVIEANAEIGDGSKICAGSYIGEYTTVGRGTLIYPNVSIRERCVVGDGVIIHSGTVIGSDGFGFEAGPSGIVKIPQMGIVQLDDGVEIGANCTIDRARFGRTWMKAGVKLDNQVHVAHNVVVGECSMLIGQCGIAGSAEIGRGVIVAAKAGINGHITLGDGARIAGTSGVVKDVPPGGTVVGTPAEPKRDFMARIILPKTVAKLKEQVKLMLERIEELERNSKD